LVEHFLDAPPVGFRVVKGLSAPAFMASFNLLTTMDDAVKQRLHRLPLFRWWSRLLKVRTLFAGSTVSEYLPLPSVASPAAWLGDVLLLAKQSNCQLAVVKDLPQASPLLLEEDNRYAQWMASESRAQGFILVQGQALAYVPIDFESQDEYLARLSSSRRKDLRRKLRSRSALRVQRLPTGSHFHDPLLVRDYYRLYGEVFDQSDIQFDRLTPQFFQAVLRDERSTGIVFEYRLESDGTLVGWNLCYEQGGRLIDKYIGLSYPLARELNLYFVSWFENLAYALERRLTHYVAGWTDPEVKASLGARFTFTQHAVFVRNPLLRAIARRFSPLFEGDRVWKEGSGMTPPPTAAPPSPSPPVAATCRDRPPPQ
jgi:hypothetical protein